MNRTQWTARNGGMVRGRWRTTYRCRTCGHLVRDDHADYRATLTRHELAHAGHNELDTAETA